MKMKNRKQVSVNHTMWPRPFKVLLTRRDGRGGGGVAVGGGEAGGGGGENRPFITLMEEY